MFDAGMDVPNEKVECFTKALFAMRWENPVHRPVMELEGLQAWMPPREDGYVSLYAAL